MPEVDLAMNRKSNIQKIPLAVALDYSESNASAPTVEGVGNGEMAKEMQRAARRYGVPVVENKELASKLSQVGLKQEIPLDSYREVAKILLKHTVEK